MDPHKQRVVHHANLPQELHIPPKLLRQKRPLLWPKRQCPAPIDPVDILQHGPRVLLRLLFRVLATKCRALEIVRFVYIAMGRKEVVHDEEMNLPAAW